MVTSNLPTVPRNATNAYWRKLGRASVFLMTAMLGARPARDEVASEEPETDARIKKANLRLTYLKAAG